MSCRPIILNSAYTLAASDKDQVLVFDSDSPVTVTVPAGLPDDFECGLVQIDSGVVTLVAAPGVSVRNRQNHAGLAGVNAFGALVAISDNLYILSGDTA